MNTINFCLKLVDFLRNVNNKTTGYQLVSKYVIHILKSGKVVLDVSNRVQSLLKIVFELIFSISSALTKVVRGDREIKVAK